MAIGPKRCGANLEVRKMDVGPSAPPMIPIEPASAGVNPMAFAQRKVTKIPICAAAPRMRLFGLAISGPKSVIAPTPMKIRQGYTPALTPIYSTSNNPPSFRIAP